MFDINVGWTHFTNTENTQIITPIEDILGYIEMSVTIVPDWNVSVYMEWEPPIHPLPGILPDPVYMIYYSESELGPFTKLSTQPIHDLSFFTTWQIQDSKVFEQYFTIECIWENGDVYRSHPLIPSAGLPKWHRLRQRDIFRREAILLDKFVGADTIIWNPKYTGKRCPECWDFTHLKIINDHCEACYGRGYEGGFDTGMRTKLQYSSIDPLSMIQYQGRVEPITISAWTISFPLIHPDAILTRMGDRRIFIVEGHQGSTEMLTNMQRQNVVLKELSRDSIENKLFNNPNFIEIMMRKPHVHI